jgi:hypothetical protein
VPRSIHGKKKVGALWPSNAAVLEEGRDGDTGVVDGGSQLQISGSLIYLEEEHGG